MYVLVDYDNQRPSYFGRRSGQGRTPNLRDHEEYLRALVGGLLQYRELLPRGMQEFKVRLYGGWTHGIGGARTESADMVASAIRNHPRSFRRGESRFRIEMAESLLMGEAEPFFGILRATKWPGEVATVTSAPPAACAETAAQCPNLLVLKSWLGGACPRRPECRVKTADVVEIRRQKLVDSMLVADTIVAATRLSDDVVVVSRDDDLIPGLISATLCGGKVSLLRFGTRSPSEFDALLRRHDVGVHDLAGL